MPTALIPPQIDPTPIFEIFRGSFGTELLTAAVTHCNLFARVAAAPLTFDELRHELGLAQRPANVLVTALRAFGLLVRDREDRLQLTPLAREHLVPGAPFESDLALKSESAARTNHFDSHSHCGVLPGRKI